MFADASGIFPFPLNGMHVMVGMAKDARPVPAGGRAGVGGARRRMQDTCGRLLIRPHQSPRAAPA